MNFLNDTIKLKSIDLKSKKSNFLCKIFAHYCNMLNDSNTPQYSNQNTSTNNKLTIYSLQSF